MPSFQWLLRFWSQINKTHNRILGYMFTSLVCLLPAFIYKKKYVYCREYVTTLVSNVIWNTNANLYLEYNCLSYKSFVFNVRNNVSSGTFHSKVKKKRVSRQTVWMICGLQLLFQWNSVIWLSVWLFPTNTLMDYCEFMSDQVLRMPEDQSNALLRNVLSNTKTVVTPESSIKGPQVYQRKRFQGQLSNWGRVTNICVGKL